MIVVEARSSPMNVQVAEMLIHRRIQAGLMLNEADGRRQS